MSRVAMFAKAPLAGYAKTRLAQSIGPEPAATAYRAVGKQVMTQVRDYPVTVWYAPLGAAAEMRAWLGHGEFLPQYGVGLGERLQRAFAFHFARGDAPVLAIGADAPQVDADVIRSALRALEVADVAIGPAVDGGYYLIGLKGPAPELFEGIPWGGRDVLQVTLDACERCHLRVFRLEPLRDLDTLEDWTALGLNRT